MLGQMLRKIRTWVVVVVNTVVAVFGTAILESPLAQTVHPHTGLGVIWREWITSIVVAGPSGSRWSVPGKVRERDGRGFFPSYSSYPWSSSASARVAWQVGSLATIAPPSLAGQTVGSFSCVRYPSSEGLHILLRRFWRVEQPAIELNHRSTSHQGSGIRTLGFLVID